jgi:hypothetical protein
MFIAEAREDDSESQIMILYSLFSHLHHSPKNYGCPIVDE